MPRSFNHRTDVVISLEKLADTKTIATSCCRWSSQNSSSKAFVIEPRKFDAVTSTSILNIGPILQMQLEALKKNKPGLELICSNRLIADSFQFHHRRSLTYDRERRRS